MFVDAIKLVKNNNGRLYSLRLRGLQWRGDCRPGQLPMARRWADLGSNCIGEATTDLGSAFSSKATTDWGGACSGEATVDLSRGCTMKLGWATDLGWATAEIEK
ncbi:hypothetical protein Salat_1721600 [Sesamum alatum]|uniref:Uncharacterized protein n=1 Tax=Sesamum alatum TaxID=300844 RepID=A0AAE1Y8F3_9LAMI|nr:hypothetical protein Salat_1721600 [Sesamum alatum]